MMRCALKTRKTPKKQKQSNWATFREILWSSLITFGAKLVAEFIVAMISAQMAADQLPQIILV
ncbi:MAG: hypothetical protein ABS35_17380 [Kaistia sp. SCN 65-12]|nr:MAG: hypothetical protein ABS35_17380 [Kaistia sp. SCN 65-12]